MHTTKEKIGKMCFYFDLLGAHEDGYRTSAETILKDIVGINSELVVKALEIPAELIAKEVWMEEELYLYAVYCDGEGDIKFEIGPHSERETQMAAIKVKAVELEFRNLVFIMEKIVFHLSLLEEEEVEEVETETGPKKIIYWAAHQKENEK